MNNLFLNIFLILLLSNCHFKGERSESMLSGDKIKNTGIEIKLSDVEIVGLLYHRFDEDKYNSTSISSKLFENQLKYLVDNKITCITFSEAIKLLKSSKSKGRYCVITIDDAFKSFYKKGYPILKKFQLKATLFMNTSTLGSGDYLTKAEIKELIGAGIEIGNHTHSHNYFLDSVPEKKNENFKNDVLKAQKILENEFGSSPSIYAHPFGEYNQEMIEIIREIGFIGAAAQNSGIISKYADLYSLPRFPMNDTYGKMDLFIQKVNAKPLPARYFKIKNTLSNTNPPSLEILIDSENLDMKRMQCFVQGGDCIINAKDTDKGLYEFRSDRILKNRRHLYTVTIPGNKRGEWYWFSHQWVFPR